MKMKIMNDNDKATIEAEMAASWGKLGSTLTIEDIRFEIGQIPDLPKRLLKGATVIVTADCSLPKAYKYTKEVGVAQAIHDGKDWIWLMASRATCWAGSTTGKTKVFFPVGAKAEIAEKMFENNGMFFR